MPRILIAGCGYVGEAAADFFHAHGWEVEGWTASTESAVRLGGKPYVVRALDIRNAGATSQVRDEFAVIVQCASSRGGTEEQYRQVYLDGARILLKSYPSATHLFVSSTSVYAQHHGEIVDETSPADPSHEKGRILRMAEDLVLAQSGIVARVAGIYGPRRSFLLKSLLAGDGLATGHNSERFINQVHRDDIVSALFLMGERRTECAGQVYNVVDDQSIPKREAIQWLSTELERSISPGTNVGEGKRGVSNKRVSNKKLRALGWELRFPTWTVGMRESVLPSFREGQVGEGIEV